MVGDEIDYEALAARLTDPDTDAPAREELRGDQASEYGRAFLLREYGSEEELATALRPGRPRLGSGITGPSPTVRARVSAEDFAAFTRLREESGRSEAELLREAVHLLLLQYKIAS